MRVEVLVNTVTIEVLCPYYCHDSLSGKYKNIDELSKTYAGAVRWGYMLVRTSQVARTACFECPSAGSEVTSHLTA